MSNSSKKLKSVVKGIVKDFEDTALSHGGKSSLPQREPMSTGFVGLDVALGIGGLPSGTWAELFGPQSAGKTTLALQILVAGQRAGESVAFIDVEHTLDRAYAEKLGLVDDDSSVIIRPKDGEDGFEMVRRLIEGGVSRIAVDSMAALLTKAERARVEKKGFQADAQPGVQARLLAQASKTLNPILSERRAFVLYTNQLRDSLNPFGSSETQPGGRAVKFYESVRMRLSRDSGKPPDERGFNTKLRVAKNKYAREGTEWGGRFVYGLGFDAEYDLVSTAHELGVIAKSGNWYVHEGQQLGVGVEKAAEFLRKDLDVRKLVVDALAAK